MTLRNEDLAVVVNPQAGAAARRREDNIETVKAVLAAGMRGRLYQVPEFGPSPDLHRFFADITPRLVVVIGGDGTLHQVLTHVRRTKQVDAPMPVILLVSGGSQNLLANELGVKGTCPTERVKRAFQEFDAGKVVSVHQHKTLLVNDELGLVYGCGMPYDLMSRFYLSEGSALKRCAAIFAKALLPWHKTDRFNFFGEMVSAGTTIRRRWTDVSGIAAGTIEDVSFGIRLLPHDWTKPGEFVTRVTKLSAGQMVQKIGTMRKGAAVPKIEDFSISEIRLTFEKPLPFILDGDLISDGAIEHHVSLGPIVNFFI